MPALIFWLVLDFALGFAILGAAIALLEVADVILNHFTTAGMWSLTAILMVTGAALLTIDHLVFERRRPAMIDNPADLLVGPMFVAAKLVVALGFRHDLGILVGKPRQVSSR
ncbi:Mpo1-like protein [Bradyrhizobium sp. 186]|uniref:Mpo1-like protein n=1 Tax=Bradyrhizobium sp. 186 TaxID=2782654 RepID=UPI002000BC56|nr:Mpo1-like protein [Bradyrhizobium sp. 186]